jgi:hypothetical protein
MKKKKWKKFLVERFEKEDEKRDQKKRRNENEREGAMWEEGVCNVES